MDGQFSDEVIIIHASLSCSTLEGTHHSQFTGHQTGPPSDMNEYEVIDDGKCVCGRRNRGDMRRTDGEPCSQVGAMITSGSPSGATELIEQFFLQLRIGHKPPRILPGTPLARFEAVARALRLMNSMGVGVMAYIFMDLSTLHSIRIQTAISVAEVAIPHRVSHRFEFTTEFASAPMLSLLHAV
jgi:hypothetical protein